MTGINLVSVNKKTAAGKIITKAFDSAGNLISKTVKTNNGKDSACFRGVFKDGKVRLFRQYSEGNSNPKVDKSMIKFGDYWSKLNVEG